jgi:haloacetate dehalogenase
MKSDFIEITDGLLHVRKAGDPSSPALVLLHGFPQTSLMWARVAALLERDYFLLMPDLRGYGQSFKPTDEAEHSQMSKRAMARDIVEMLDRFDISQAFVCGHDRGGRVAHRLALDWRDRVRKLSLIDIAPTLDMYKASDMTFARAYYHWFHLIQPAPLPERMIAGDAMNYLHTKLGGWGGAGTGFIESEALAEYERCFTGETIHTMCEDYRASSGIDLAHDEASRKIKEKISCETLVLWGSKGVVQRLFKPLKLWQAQCSAIVTGQTMPAGHFIPEELPDETAQLLKAFFV